MDSIRKLFIINDVQEAAEVPEIEVGQEVFIEEDAQELVGDLVVDEVLQVLGVIEYMESSDEEDEYYEARVDSYDDIFIMEDLDEGKDDYLDAQEEVLVKAREESRVEVQKGGLPEALQGSLEQVLGKDLDEGPDAVLEEGQEIVLEGTQNQEETQQSSQEEEAAQGNLEDDLQVAAQIIAQYSFQDAPQEFPVQEFPAGAPTPAEFAANRHRTPERAYHFMEMGFGYDGVVVSDSEDEESVEDGNQGEVHQEEPEDLEDLEDLMAWLDGPVNQEVLHAEEDWDDVYEFPIFYDPLLAHPDLPDLPDLFRPDNDVVEYFLNGGGVYNNPHDPDMDGHMQNHLYHNGYGEDVIYQNGFGDSEEEEEEDVEGVLDDEEEVTEEEAVTEEDSDSESVEY